jgi:hypothetical protein
VACSSSKTDTAKQNVLKYVKEYGNDPKSYEFISLRLDTPKINYTETPAGKALEERVIELTVSQPVSVTDMLAPVVQKYKGIDSVTMAKMLKAAEDSTHLMIIDTSRGNWIGIHSYRGKNGFGATMLFNDTVYFDKEYNIKEYIPGK